MASKKYECFKIRVISIFILAFLSLPFYQITEAESSTNIVINEIMYNPNGSEVEGEWIELFNVGNDIDVKNWSLTDRDGATFIFPDLVVPSHSFVLIYITVGNITHQPHLITLFMNRTWSMLNNGGDDLLLVDSQGTAVDYVNYGSGSAIDYPISPADWMGVNKTVSEGLSYALIPDGDDLDTDENWQEAIPSPGTFNSVDEVYNILITEVYYNAHRDNEFFVIHNPFEEDIDISNWNLDDLEGAVFFPSGTIIRARNSLIIAENSTSFYEDTLTDADFQTKSGNKTSMIVGGVFKLKNDGDELILRNGAGRVIDVFCHGSSNYSSTGWSGESAGLLDKGKIAKRKLIENNYIDTNTSDDWNSIRKYGIGQSSFQLTTIYGIAEVIAFSSPDSSYNVISNTIDNANSEICIALYELTNWHLAQHLLTALDRGVEIKLLLEGLTVSGMKEEEKYIMKLIAEKGGKIELMVHNTSMDIYERYRYLHAKYAVIDNEISILTSENWGETGIPKNNTYGNRGWGIRVKNVVLANELLKIFYEDWNPLRRDISVYTPEDYLIQPGYVPSIYVQTGFYDTPFIPHEITDNFSFTPVLSPDTSLDEDAIIGMIREAENSIQIEQFYIVQEWNNEYKNPYLEEVIEAARRGVEVKILLDDSDYNIQPDEIDNDDIVRTLNDIAISESLDMQAKLFNSLSHGVVKLHNKGIIVDSRKTLISSINWNYNSITNNREIGVIVESKKVSEYFSNIFNYDWKEDVHAPIAFGCVDRTIIVGEEIVFDGSSSYDTNPITFKWDFNGDGTIDSTEPVAKHVYDQIGYYHVSLNVSDSSDNSNISSCVIEVVTKRSDEREISDDVPTWIFYVLIISITIFIILYIKKRSSKGKNI